MELRGNKNRPLKLTDNNESPEGRFSGRFSGHQIRTPSFYCWRVFNLYFYRAARLQLRPPPPDAGRHRHTNKLTLRDTNQSHGAGCLVLLITWSELCDFSSSSHGFQAPVGEIVCVSFTVLFCRTGSGTLCESVKQYNAAPLKTQFTKCFDRSFIKLI